MRTAVRAGLPCHVAGCCSLRPRGAWKLAVAGKGCLRPCAPAHLISTKGALTLPTKSLLRPITRWQSTPCSAEAPQEAATGIEEVTDAGEASEQEDGWSGGYRYRALVSYDGTDFRGWQQQPGFENETIQGRLLQALSVVTREPPEVLRVVGSGRTDKGVHATGQVIHFDTRSLLDSLPRVHLQANGCLPDEIRIHEVAPVTAAFHARHSASTKTYHYHLCTKPVLNPLSMRYAWHIYHKVCLEDMQEAALAFVGERDFTAMANLYALRWRYRQENNVRTILRFDIVPTEDGVRVEVEGTGFLYKQVRNMVGVLVEAGRGRYTRSAVEAILASRDRQNAPWAAPPHGLVLHNVTYPAEVLGEPEDGVGASFGNRPESRWWKERRLEKEKSGSACSEGVAVGCRTCVEKKMHFA